MDTANHEIENWTQIADAAQLLGTTPLNVLMHVKRGLLIGVEHEDGWLVDPASLGALVEKRRQGAVPEVCQSGCVRKTGGCGSCG